MHQVHDLHAWCTKHSQQGFQVFQLVIKANDSLQYNKAKPLTSNLLTFCICPFTQHIQPTCD